MHELRVERFELVGGNRDIELDAPFAIITGSITTGKTTVVRLLKALLGRVPDHLPPETAIIRSVRGRLFMNGETWLVDRPLVRGCSESSRRSTCELLLFGSLIGI